MAHPWRRMRRIQATEVTDLGRPVVWTPAPIPGMPRGLRSGRATTLHTATGQGEVRVKRAPRHGAVFRQVAQIIVGMHARALGD